METTVASALALADSEDATRELIEGLRSQLAGQPPRLVVLFAASTHSLRDTAAAVAGAFDSAIVLSSSTAGEFTESRDAKGALCAMAVAGDFIVHAGIGTELQQDAMRAVSTAIGDFPSALDDYPHRTGIMLLDPLTGVGEEATLIAGSLLGPDVPLAGGAAGDDLKMSRTEVGLGARVETNAVVLAMVFSKKPLGLGVCHGHQAIAKGLHVTRALGATVFEVDGKPAWDVWREHTRKPARDIGIDVDALPDAEVGAYLLRYEAGLESGDELKIRAPLARGEDGSLAFACGIPEGAEICITESVPERQISSAREASKRARERLEGPPAGAIVFDCICRNLILKDAFQTAVGAISDELGGVPIAGFETYGEIALQAGDMSGFHNTTTVVLAFPR
jgi:methyl-accepting chemotaxis protein